MRDEEAGGTWRPPRPRGRVVVLDGADALAERAASEFVSRAGEAAAARGRFMVALSGGSTPRGANERLAAEPFRSRVPWASVHLFWGDERHVPPSDPQSNYRMVRDTLLSKIEIPPENVHRIEAERPAPEAAALYDAELRRAFGVGSADGEPPRFDLIFLGIGPDGHTASLFPGTDVLEVRDRWAAAVWVPRLSTHRVTLTIPVFRAARAILFLVSGEDKAAILSAALDPATPADAFPALRVRPDRGELVWLVDRAAAGRNGPAD